MKKANGKGKESSRFRGCGILDEELLLLIFNTIKWDLQLLCKTASLNRKLRAIAERVLWQQLCLNRAPKMSQALTNGVDDRVSGGWHSLAKLMFFCCGCEFSTPHFKVTQPMPGHFVKESRFSKTSGRSFLAKKCRGDVLYVSDPCEHPISNRGRGRDRGDDDEDGLIVGIYRGVFRRFMKSKTREMLLREEVGFEEGMKCPYCGARVWSMTTAKLVPKSAARRLGTHNGGLEYFVCLNGHLHGSCWLLPLSESESESEEEEEDDRSQMGLEDESATSSTTGEPEIEIVAPNSLI